MKTAIVRVVVWIDGVEHGSAEAEVPADLAPYVAQHAVVAGEDPDLDLAFENQTAVEGERAKRAKARGKRKR